MINQPKLEVSNSLLHLGVVNPFQMSRHGQEVKLSSNNVGFVRKNVSGSQLDTPTSQGDSWNNIVQNRVNEMHTQYAQVHNLGKSFVIHTVPIEDFSLELLLLNETKDEATQKLINSNEGWGKKPVQQQVKWNIEGIVTETFSLGIVTLSFSCVSISTIIINFRFSTRWPAVSCSKHNRIQWNRVVGT